MYTGDMYMYMLMRDEEGSKVKQTNKQQSKATKQSNTAHPRQSLFPQKMSCLRCMHR